MSEWLEFQGEVADLGNGKVFCKASKGSVMVLSSSEMKEDHVMPLIRARASVTVTEMPSGDCPHSQPNI